MGGGARRRGPGPELQWPRLRHPPGPSAVKGVSAPLQSLQLPARWPPGASHSRGVSARPRDGVPGLMGRGAERATAPPSPGGGGCRGWRRGGPSHGSRWAPAARRGAPASPLDSKQCTWREGACKPSVAFSMPFSPLASGGKVPSKRLTGKEQSVEIGLMDSCD